MGEACEEVEGGSEGQGPLLAELVGAAEGEGEEREREKEKEREREGGRERVVVKLSCLSPLPPLVSRCVGGYVTVHCQGPTREGEG